MMIQMSQTRDWYNVVNTGICIVNLATTTSSSLENTKVNNKWSNDEHQSIMIIIFIIIRKCYTTIYQRKYPPSTLFINIPNTI